jgi:hypothetical protein
MPGWTVHDIKLDLANVSALLVKRSPPDGSDDLAIASFEKLKCSMMTAICGLVDAIDFMDNGAALELHDAVTAVELPEDSKLVLQRAIDTKLEASAGMTAPGAAPTKKPQTLIHPGNYLTQEDWDDLMCPKASLFRMTMVFVQRYKKLGVRMLHEQTVRWAVAALVCLWSDRIGKLPSHTLIFELVKDFKKAWEACPYDPSHSGLPMLHLYPEHVADLPAGFLTKAYGSAGPPITKVMEKLAHVALHHVALRSNSKLLKADKLPGSGCPSSSSSNGSPIMPIDQFIRQAISSYQQQAHQQQHPQQQQHQQQQASYQQQAHQQQHQPAHIQMLPPHNEHQLQFHQHQQQQPQHGSPQQLQTSDSPSDSPQVSSSDSPMGFKPLTRLSSLQALESAHMQIEGHAHGQSSGPAHVQPDGSARVSSEDYENAAYQAYLTGEFKKKVTSKGKGRGKGRGKGSGRGSATAEDMPDEVPTQPSGCAKGSANPKGSAKGNAKPKGCAKPKAKPSGCAKGPAYGCPKCRQSAVGCAQCRSPKYKLVKKHTKK